MKTIYFPMKSYSVSDKAEKYRTQLETHKTAKMSGPQKLIKIHILSMGTWL